MEKPTEPVLQALCSGGQTGVDRATLDVALAARLRVTGWCPRGRKAEDGPLEEHYPLQETPSAEYSQRTDWNIRDSEGTLVLFYGETDPGTALTIKKANQRSRPLLVVDLAEPLDCDIILRWVWRSKIQHLNVAGPRESYCPGIYQAARVFLEKLFTHLF